MCKECWGEDNKCKFDFSDILEKKLWWLIKFHNLKKPDKTSLERIKKHGFLNAESSNVGELPLKEKI